MSRFYAFSFVTVTAGLTLLAIGICAVTFGGDESSNIPPVAPPAVRDVTEFDADKTVAEGRLWVVVTDRRQHDRLPAKIKIPVNRALPVGTKVVRMWFNDANHAYCLSVTHPTFDKTSPVARVPVLPFVLKVGE